MGRKRNLEKKGWKSHVIFRKSMRLRSVDVEPLVYLKQDRASPNILREVALTEKSLTEDENGGKIHSA